MANGNLKHADAKKAVVWALEVLGMADWSVTVSVAEKPPDDLDQCGRNPGLSMMMPSRKTATVWVGSQLCAMEGLDPLTILFHEIMHVSGYDTGTESNDPTDMRVEYHYDRLAAVMAFAYRKGMKA